MFRGYSLRHLQLIFERLLDLKLYAGGVVGTFCHDKTISMVEIGFTGVKLKRHVSPVVVHGRMFKGRKINTGLYIPLHIPHVKPGGNKGIRVYFSVMDAFSKNFYFLLHFFFDKERNVLMKRGTNAKKGSS